MHQPPVVTTDRKGPTEPLEGGSAGLVSPATSNPNKRGRVSLRQASVEAAVRLLCSLTSREADYDELVRLASYAKDGF